MVVNAATDPTNLFQLALADLQRGLFAAAESKCRAAIAIDSRHVGALSVLGVVLHSCARHTEAITVFNQLTTLQPDNPEHWMNLGAALRPERKYDEALAAYSQAQALGMNSADLYYNQGMLQLDRCDYESAYPLLLRATAMSPNDAGIRCAFAQCCYDLLRFDEALLLLEKWQSLQSLTPELIAQIAYLLLTMGAPELADAAVHRAIAAQSQAARASLVLVRVLERTNRLTEARALLNRLEREQNQLLTDSDFLLAQATVSQRENDHEAAIPLLSRALENHTDFARRHHLLFPLAKSLDSLKRYDEAYDALEEAHRSQVSFLRATAREIYEGGSPTLALTLQSCDAQDVAQWDNNAAPAVEASPIFIVAFPRSGTTLLEQTLDAHPLLKSMDEQPFLKKAIDDIIEGGVSYPNGLAKLSGEQLSEIRKRYWERVRGKVQLLPGQRLVDKNPFNLLRLPAIRRLFPNSRILLAVRHPGDVIASCFMQHFRAPDLALMCRDLPALFNSYRRAFDFWYSQQSQLDAPVYELKYETFVADPDTEIRRVAEFLNLPWHQAMLAPDEHARAKTFISTPSYTQVIQPINNRSVNRWRAYETPFRELMPLITPYLERWSYPT